MDMERLKDRLKYFARYSDEMERELEDMFTRHLDEIEEGLREAGYSPESEGSKKETYESLQNMRGRGIERLARLKCDIGKICNLFATISDELDARAKSDGEV